MRFILEAATFPSSVRYVLRYFRCLFCLCWLKTLSYHSDHCRVMGCMTREGGRAAVLGEMDVARAKAFQARAARGVGGSEKTFGEDKNRDR